MPGHDCLSVLKSSGWTRKSGPDDTEQILRGISYIKISLQLLLGENQMQLSALFLAVQ